ncbi:MAG: low specificity L-threonine aldolase [Parachlamydiales bacterium]|nr:low specificity L-threonine aldolase [Candidatus Acheromyda pituitae]
MNRSFASDNFAPVHPRIMQAIIDCNEGHQRAYGADEMTQEAVRLFQEQFGKDCDVYFVFNGTAANVLGLKTIAHSHQTVFCSNVAHINVDECGAPEKYTGCKLIVLPEQNGKISIEHIRPYLVDRGVQHRSQPKVVSITQATELGTLYAPEEIRAIADFAHANGMLLHMDGARIGNAAAALKMPLRALTRDLGVDVLSFGGTKNGMMFGEAVIFFDRSLSKEFPYIRKQGMQLASKMRYLSAQFVALLSDGLWLKNASHANAMAQLLYRRVQKELPDIPLTRQVEANAVFALLPKETIPALQEHTFFWVWDDAKGEVRWMTSWDTQPEDIEQFIAVVKQHVI